MDDFLDENKSLDELHQELVLELERLKGKDPAELTFSDADLVLYVLEMYCDTVKERYAYLKDTPRMQILARLKRNLDDQLKLMENRESPSQNLWIAAGNLAARYLATQNSHTIA